MTDTLPGRHRTRPGYPDDKNRLAGWSQRHHWRAIGLWVIALAGITGQRRGNRGRLSATTSACPARSRRQLMDAYEKHSPAQQGDTVTIVVEGARRGRRRRPECRSSSPRVSALDGVAPRSRRRTRGGTISDNGTIGLAQVQLANPPGENDPDDVLRDHRHRPGVRRLKGCGWSWAATPCGMPRKAESGGGGEGAGILAALVILVFLFGSLLAAACRSSPRCSPSAARSALIMLASHVFTVADFTRR